MMRSARVSTPASGVCALSPAWKSTREMSEDVESEKRVSKAAGGKI